MADPAAEIDEGPPETATAAPASAVAAPAAAPPPGPDFTSMVRPPSDMAGVQTKLADIQRQKTATNEANSAETIKRLETDRARMEAAYKASAVMPEELKPGNGWNSDQQAQKYSTDPVQAFGSIGSVFAMLATSFAGLPMEHALNAGAAAINAVHAGDEKAYQRAYDSWQKNTELAIKRHDIQRQAYNDATNLMNSNINAGRTKMEMAATKFGDQKAQALLDAGMDKELFDLFASRNKTALELQNSWDKVNLEHEKVTDLRADPRFQSADQNQKAAAIQEWNQRWAPNGGQKLRYDFTKDAVDAYKRANPDWTPEGLLEFRKQIANAEEPEDTSKSTGMQSNTPEKLALNRFIEQYKANNDGREPSADELADFHKKWRQSPAGATGMNANTPEKAFIADRAKALMQSENREPTAEERLQWKQDWTQAQTKKSTSSGAQKASAIQQIVDDDAAKGVTTSIADATKRYNLKVATPSGNRIDDINKQIDMFDNGKTAIDKALAAIDKHWGTPGIAGYVGRGAERVGNIFGSNDTDRVQFAHDIQYLQTVAPRLMNDASSRGLKAEADKIGAIIAGLNVGDTTANTKRALSEVRELWDKMQKDNLARRSGTPNLGGTGGEPGSPPPAGTSGGAGGSKKAPWLNDPVVKPAGPRSDAGDGAVMSDADPEGASAGQQYAQLRGTTATGYGEIPPGKLAASPEAYALQGRRIRVGPKISEGTDYGEGQIGLRIHEALADAEARNMSAKDQIELVRGLLNEGDRRTVERAHP